MSLDQAYDVRAAAADGLTIAQAAEELGCSYDAARYRAIRAGVKLGQIDAARVRNRAERMKPRDAVDYLLGVVDSLQAALIPAVDRPVELPRLQARCFDILAARPGEFVHRDTLYDGVYHDVHADDRPTMLVVAGHVRCIRQKLPAHVGRIEGCHGLGYRFVPAAADRGAP